MSAAVTRAEGIYLGESSTAKKPNNSLGQSGSGPTGKEPRTGTSEIMGRGADIAGDIERGQEGEVGERAQWGNGKRGDRQES